MKGTEQFKQTIKAYLDERAKTDELFATWHWIGLPTSISFSS